MKCKICESESFYFANANILNKYDAAYFKCTNCGFVQTEEPYWLEEAYSQPIAETDSGLVFRNYMLARIATNIITKIFNSNANFLDYAAGYGLFVRLMRDIRFNFYWYDKYCDNIFAKGWEANLQDDRQYELITAFEVFEHFVNPIDEINKLLNYSRNILFSTELLPENQPKPQEWWYYAPHEGQHISLYTPKSLSIIAERLGLNLYSNGSSIHLLTEKNIPQDLFERLSHYDSLALKGFLLSSRDYLQTFEKIDSEQYKEQWYQTQKELAQSQSQLYTSEAKLQQSQTQLHQTQADFAQAQSQLHQTETELEKFQLQLHTSQEELEQSQSQLHQ
ncbi:class I SAM-dependent methyltransferase, partial [Kamptonema sp. PCC 6506]|uniref:class I SAM-dependent methyltransferase n=2 Tax=Kamptonema TaxID=1501433 RepID=UPI0012F4E296